MKRLTMAIACLIATAGRAQVPCTQDTLKLDLYQGPAWTNTLWAPSGSTVAYNIKADLNLKYCDGWLMVTPHTNANVSGSYTWASQNFAATGGTLASQNIYKGISNGTLSPAYDNMQMKPGTNQYVIIASAVENGMTCYMYRTVTVEMCNTVGIEELEMKRDAKPIYHDLMGNRVENPERNVIYVRTYEGIQGATKVVLID